MCGLNLRSFVLFVSFAFQRLVVFNDVIKPQKSQKKGENSNVRIEPKLRIRKCVIAI